MNALSASSVTIVRGTRRVLQDVSVHVQPGELVALLGANGAGKSSLLAALAGELPPAGGDVAIDGQPLARLTAQALARRRAVLPQQSGLSFEMTVRDVVAMGAYPFPALAPARVEALLADAMARAEVGQLARRRYPALSGGEQQRVHLARTMLQVLAGSSIEPTADEACGRHGYLLLDEPTAGQDPAHQLQVLRAVHQLAASGRAGVLAVLHDMTLAATWCDRTILLADGRVLADGPPQAVLTAANIRRAYGIEAAVMPHPLHAGRHLVVY